MMDAMTDAMNGLPLIQTLSRGQLEAYNKADLDAFCAFYHPDVEVFDAFGRCTLRGISAFRARYGELFSEYRDISGVVDLQVVLGPHIVERETWSRVARKTGERTAGVVLVRYTAADGKIRVAEFLRA